MLSGTLFIFKIHSFIIENVKCVPQKLVKCEIMKNMVGVEDDAIFEGFLRAFSCSVLKSEAFRFHFESWFGTRLCSVCLLESPQNW